MRTRAVFGAATVGLLVAMLGGSPATFAASENPTLFHAKTAEGEVWVSVELARHRTDESFIPLVVAVRNSGDGVARIDRSSFTLVGADGTVEALPDVPTLRRGYGKDSFDRAILQGDGFPVGTRLASDRAMPSNFFPDISQRAGVRLDEVSLPSLYWTADILYFKRPVGFAEGRDVTLKVTPEGWEAPIKIRLHV